MKSAYSDRHYTIGFIFIAVAAIFVIRLFFIQIITDEYRINANNNVLRYVTIYPDRGLIFDRNGKSLVENEASYDLMVTPRLAKGIDTMELCKILDLTKEEYITKMVKATKYSKHKASVFIKEISKEVYGVLQEKLFKYKGFVIQRRTVRRYPRDIGGHLLGYIGEVSPALLEKNTYYGPGDYIGLTGIEKSYEEILRGKRGLKIMMVDVFGRMKGSFKEGRYDTTAISGMDLKCTIDADLQEYGEQLMQNKRGSIVAIEPSTGEILALVSSPTYKPSDFVGRNFSKSVVSLYKDPSKPLLNRALIAQYPPGSTFKLVNALIALQTGTLKTYTTYSCSRGFHGGGLSVGCHEHSSPLDLRGSIQHSCNAYYCNLFWSLIDRAGYKTSEEGYNAWRKQVLSFGFGKRFDDDLPSELNGNVPSSKFYNKYHGKNRWKALTVISLSIGQGEMLVTPLQLANQAATIANRGYYITPHVVKAIGSKNYLPAKFAQKHFTTVARQHFEPVIEGMHDVIEAGTGRIAKLPDITMAGKTGTAQNPHGEDHSIFILFAPVENPKIALCVIVENGGFGAEWAAPIASLMVEKYMKDSISRPELEKKMLEGKIYYK